MKKLINRPEVVVEEMVEGLAALHPGLRRLPGHTVLVRADAVEAIVAPPTSSTAAARVTMRCFILYLLLQESRDATRH